MEYLNTIIAWIKQKTLEANASGVIVGVSGGIDSALVAYLAKKAFPNNSKGIILPINDSREFDKTDAIELCDLLDLDYQIINLKEAYINISTQTNLKQDLTKGNLQARLRMSTIYAIAQENNYLVLGTDNKAEYELGYFTKFGDGACDLLPIVHLYKSEVFAYAKQLSLPNSIINKTPSAGLWDGQSDEQELGFTYDDYENFCKGKNLDSEIIKKIQKQIARTEHKRVPIPKAPERDK